MTEPGGILALILGSNVLNTGLTAWITARVSKKKDAGELASDLLTQCIADIATLKSDNHKCQTETAALKEIATRNDLVIRLVVPELHRVAPFSTSLQQARDLLGEAFPVHLDTPQDMQDQLRRMGP